MKDRWSNRDGRRMGLGINMQQEQERTDARKEVTDAPGRHQWKQVQRLRGAATAWKREDNSEFDRKAFELESVKQATGISRGLRKMRN
jgi:hypothetical protein